MNAPLAGGGLHVLVVDDHIFSREGVRRIFEVSGQGWDVTDEGSAYAALDQLKAHPFELVIADLSMPGMNGLEFIRRVRNDHPRLPVLVLSMHAEEEYALRAFKAGANGYLTKDCAAGDLLEAARKVLQGGAYVTPSLAERVVSQLNGSVEVPRHARLSNRELEVLRRIVAGQRMVEIAQALHLSVKTVSTHKARIMARLQLGSVAALVRYGMQHGLLPDESGTYDDDAAPAARTPPS